jgi:hypothetical protein
MSKHLSCTLSRLPSSKPVAIVRVPGCLPGLYPIYVYWVRARLTDNASYPDLISCLDGFMSGLLQRGSRGARHRAVEAHRLGMGVNNKDAHRLLVQSGAMELSRSRPCDHRLASASLSLVLDVRNRRVREFAIQRFAISKTAAKEFRPWRHRNLRCDLFWQQSPKLRMMPAQGVTGTVTVSANTRAQTPDLLDQCRSIHSVQIRIHCVPDRSALAMLRTLSLRNAATKARARPIGTSDGPDR